MHSALYGALDALLRRCEEVESETALSEASLSDAAYLAAIQKHGRRGGVSGVARALSVSQPAASNSICRLEERGFAHRIVQRGLRSQAILLTQEGAMVLSSLAASEEEVIAGVFDVLSPSERAMLVGLISRTFSLSAEVESNAEAQSSSAPSLASTTWSTQQIAEPAQPLASSVAAAAPAPTPSHLMNRGRPAREAAAPVQNPMHMGQPRK